MFAKYDYETQKGKVSDAPKNEHHIFIISGTVITGGIKKMS